MIVILDTNVVVSALLTDRGVCAQILDALFARQFDVTVSDPIVAEYEEVLARPHLRISREKAASFLAYIHDNAILTTPLNETFGLPDPDDEIFLVTAAAAGADYLVTGNLRHFPPALRRGVRVISPAEFLKLLKK